MGYRLQVRPPALSPFNMKHNATWFFNFFNALSNWTTGHRYENGNYCAVGHLQHHEGITDNELLEGSPVTRPYGTPLVRECAHTIFNGHIEDIWRTNDRGHDPKNEILRVCRRAILRENPECQLGKEYDT